MTKAPSTRLLLLLSMVCLFLLAACGSEVVPTAPPVAIAKATTASTDTNSASSITETVATATPVIETATPVDTQVPVSLPPTVTAMPPADTATAEPVPATDTPQPIATATMPVSLPTASPTTALRQLATVTPVPSPTVVVPPTATPGAMPASSWQKSGPGVGEIALLVADPNKPRVVYAGGQTGLARSADGGKTWQALANDFAVRQIAIAPSDSNIIYAGTAIGCASGIDGELHRSADGGKTWKTVSGGPHDIDINPTDPNRLVALSCDGVYRSTDGGGSWTKLPGSGVQNLDGYKMVRGVDDRTVIYAMYVSEGGSGAVQRTTDDARTWQVLPTTEFSSPIDIAVDPTDARHVYVVAGTGFFSSADAGDTFNRHDEGLTKGGAEPNVASGENLLHTGNLALDTVNPAPAGANYTLYLLMGDAQTSSTLVRWNAAAWEPAAQTPSTIGGSGAELLAVNDSNAPALLTFAGDQVYRLGTGR